jgi:molybdenum cofactor cytidylyltransferase
VTRVAVIVLAAGRSTRFTGADQSKLLALVGGVAVVRRAVDSAIAAAVGEVVVITGARPIEVEHALSGTQARFVHEPRFAEGMAYSLRCGVDASRDADAVLVALGDQPGMRPEAYRLVAARWRASGAAIVVPRYAGDDTPGHPVLFASSTYSELLALEGDVGARAVIARDASRVVHESLPWPPPPDIDTVQDLEAFTNAHSRERAESAARSRSSSNVSESP